MTLLIVARHGNTFDPGQPPLRIGARSDLPLSQSGEEQARRIGQYLKDKGLRPDMVFTSSLRRTQQTANLALKEADWGVPGHIAPFLCEIDYGPDEGKTEHEVAARIGDEALRAWENNGIAPPGWDADPDAICKAWQQFAREIRSAYPNGTVMAVTSNGIARFVARALTDPSAFPGKVGTGALCLLKAEGDQPWQVTGWNIRPELA